MKKIFLGILIITNYCLSMPVLANELDDRAQNYSNNFENSKLGNNSESLGIIKNRESSMNLDTLSSYSFDNETYKQIPFNTISNIPLDDVSTVYMQQSISENSEGSVDYIWSSFTNNDVEGNEWFSFAEYPFISGSQDWVSLMQMTYSTDGVNFTNEKPKLENLKSTKVTLNGTISSEGDEDKSIKITYPMIPKRDFILENSALNKTIIPFKGDYGVFSSDYPVIPWYGETIPGLKTGEFRFKKLGANVTANYEDMNGMVISPEITQSGYIGDDYQTESLPIAGYQLCEIKGNTEGLFTNKMQEVTYVYSRITPGEVIVEYWEYDIEGNPVKQIHDNTMLSGSYGERYHAEPYYIKGYGFNGVVEDFSPISGLFNENNQIVKLSYTKQNSVLSNGTILIQYQDEQGNSIAQNDTKSGEIGSPYVTKEKLIDGYKLKEVIGNTTGNYTKDGTVVTYVYKKIGSTVPDEVKIPVWRAYNINDGDHLYTTSKDEYNWIVGLKWQAEGIAFQSVLSSYEEAIPVYRLYNPNSGEHFFTVSESEYNGVASKGWIKEQVGFYMVPKEKGNTVYRVFNPNATGPGSHLFTSSKEESTWLINQGWKDEGIAFYSAK